MQAISVWKKILSKNFFKYSRSSVNARENISNVPAYPTVISWGADIKAIDGQSLVTRRVLEKQASVSWISIFYPVVGYNKILGWAWAVLLLWRVITFGRANKLYLVCSRSNFGFIRDIPPLVTSFLGVRIFVHVHGSDIVELLGGRWISPIARALYKKCKIIVPSEHLLSPLAALGFTDVIVCENFVAEANTSKELAEFNSTEQLSILWNSNIMSSKGFFDVAAAVADLANAGVAVQLIALGRPLGDQEKSLDETTVLLKQLEANEWFSYLGTVDPKKVKELVNRTDIIALPSRYRSECQPLAIIEAMCYGKMIIASDTPALHATLRDYPSLFVCEGNDEQLGAAILECRNRKKDFGGPWSHVHDFASEQARIRFGVGRFDHQMEDILTKVFLPKERDE